MQLIEWDWTASGRQLLAAAAAVAILAVLVWRRRVRSVAASLALVMLAAGGWAVAYALELAAADPASQQLWADLKFVGLCLLPPAWVVFTLRWTGRAGWLSSGTLALLAVNALAMLVILANEQTRDLVFALTPDAADPAARVEYGPLYWVNLGYTGAVVLSGSVLLVLTLVRLSRVYRRRRATLLAALLLPWVAAAVTPLAADRLDAVDLTPFGFAASTLVIAWAVLRLRLTMIAPLTRGVAFDTIHDGVIVLDVAGRVVDLNLAAIGILHTTVAQALGRALRDLLPRHADVVLTRFGLKSQRTEIALREPEQTWWYELTLSKLRDPTGQSIGQVVVLHDITARRRATEELRHSEERLQTVVSNVPVILFACDDQGICTMSEGRALETLGLAPGEMVGRPLFGSHPDFDRIVADLYMALAGEPVREVVRAGERAFETQYRPLRDRDGTITGVIGVATDVTERERVERVRADLSHRLITAQEDERRRLASDLHDDAIQVLAAAATDYAALQARLEATLEPGTYVQVKSQLDRVQKNLGEGLQSARTFLFNLRPPLLDDKGLAAAVEQQLERHAERTGWETELIWELDERLEPDMETVAFRTLQEALTNVAKHARATRVTVRGRPQDHAVVIEVRDDGVGFDLAEARRRLPVFGHLGLRSMSERVETVGGVFEVTTRPGHGTILSLWLPRARRQPDPASEAERL